MSEQERFWTKVDKRTPDQCWPWKASCFWDGYGQFSRNRIMRRAHRVVWEYMRGQIPAGLCVCHHCDNPPCVNPAHLFLGTNAENTADKVRKNRQSRQDVHGTRNPNAKLTEADVLEIRSAVGTFRAIGARYGISGRMVSYITSGQSWSRVKETT